MNRNLIYMAILVLSASACTKESFPEKKSGTEKKILLSARIASLASPAFSPKVYVWADKTSGTAYFNAWELVSDETGNLTPIGEMQYFPDGDETLNLYALSGNFAPGDIAAGGTPFPGQGLVYMVESDQRGEAGYAHSDLLYAVQENAAKTDGGTNLRFYHMLSKVEVVLKPGGGITAEELKGATVQINARTVGNFTPGKVTAAALADLTVRNGMLAVAGEPGTIHTSPKVMDDATKQEYGTVIFFPQTVRGRFITVTLPSGKSYYYTPVELTFESGKHYVFRLTPNKPDLKVELEVEDWTDGGSVTAQPDLVNKITIDAATELPPQAAINPTNDVLTMSHLPAEFTLVLHCDDELELIPDAGLPLTVEPLAETSWNGSNRFRITKTLIPPKFPQERAVLRFQRKGITEAYKEDTITLVSRENPLVIKGQMVFDRRTYTYDFGKYIDGEMGLIELPEGKQATLTVEQGEDIWAKLDATAGESAKRRILGGWKPNDPKGDGREQSVTLTISDIDGSNPEKYIIKRRNWGLPVISIDGTWWCKYNLRGNGVNFADQILSTNDPSSGGNLYEYLQSCPENELRDMLGDQYQGGFPQGLPLVWDEAKSVFYYEGMRSSSPGFGAVVDSLMVPSGYRLPLYADYKVFTKQNSESFNLGGPGTITYQNAHNKSITASVATRDVSFWEHHYGVIGFYEFQVGNDKDKIVLCGLGHQFETTHGKLVPMYILLATLHNSKSWAIVGEANTGQPEVNTFKFQNRNTRKTHTIRCIKSPVEYMY